jgi:hypothetical protein
MPIRPSARGDVRAEARAHALLTREALPRLLRLVADPEAEGEALMAALSRRLGEAGSHVTVAAEEAAEAKRAAARLVTTAVREEAARRLAALGTDGTP